MKRNQQILLLVVVMLGLMGVLVLKSSIRLKPTDTEVFQKMMGTTTADMVTSVLLNNTAGELSLNRDGETWVIGDLPADKLLIDELLASLLTPTKIVVVSETAAQHEKLGVTEELATRLALESSSGTTELLVGTPATEGRHLRFADADKVFLVKDIPAEAVLTDVADWIDTIITRIPQSSLSRISILREGDEVVLRQESSSWYSGEETEKLDTTNIDSLFNTLTSFVTQGLAEDEPSGEAYMQVTIEREGAEPIKLDFYRGKAEGEVLVKSSERAGFYVISDATAENFEINKTDLKTPLVTE